jgi:hypothetical protein
MNNAIEDGYGFPVYDAVSGKMTAWFLSSEDADAWVADREATATTETVGNTETGE